MNRYRKLAMIYRAANKAKAAARPMKRVKKG